MKKILLLVSAAIIGVSFLAAPAKAQGVPQSVEITKVDVQKLAAGYRASKVIGSSVINEANETIGKIDDLLVTRDGKEPYAVLSVGGFLAWAPGWWLSVTTASNSPTTRLCCRAEQRTGLRCCLRFNTLRTDCPRCRWQLFTGFRSSELENGRPGWTGTALKEIGSRLREK